MSKSNVGRSAIPADHDDILGLVLARAVQHGCDATAVLLVCRRWRDALLGRARGVKVVDTGFNLLARSPGLLSLSFDKGCDRLPWQLQASGGGAVPPQLLHLTQLTRLECPDLVEGTIYGRRRRLDDIAVLRSLRSLNASKFYVQSDRDFRAFSNLTALTELDVAECLRTGNSSLAVLLSSLSHLRGLASLNLGRTPLEGSAQLDGLSAFAMLTRFEVSWVDTNVPVNCDVSHLSRLRRLASLSMRGITTAMSPQLSLLTALTELTRLVLSWRRQNEAAGYALQHLCRLAALSSLELTLKAGLTPAQLSELSTLRTLTHLTLECAFCNDGSSGLACVSSLTDLRSFVCDTPHTEETDLANLRPLRQLTWLSLEGAYNISGPAMAQLAALSGLRRLDLGGIWVPPEIPIDDCDTPDLRGLGGLENLHLSWPNPTTPACLLGLSRLTSLELSCTYRDRVTLRRVSTCMGDLVSLRECSVKHAVLCVEFCAALGALPSVQAIEFEHCEIGLGCLAKLSEPTALRLRGCVASAAAIASVSALQRLRLLEARLMNSLGGQSTRHDAGEALQCLLSVIPALQQLTRVALRCTGTPDLSLQPLARLPALRSVVINCEHRWEYVNVWKSP